ncbi:Uncharacterized protein APZ42_006703 [Daphnia magna]|uniref:Uncharacterized protein n=1 Tax=Daphnia magna TaxID=35525 RepID=A0A164FR31_9CRUS|nr:Uncharacterized protein APZ42_006703 [Daphnia magna]
MRLNVLNHLMPKLKLKAFKRGGFLVRVSSTSDAMQILPSDLNIF